MKKILSIGASCCGAPAPLGLVARAPMARAGAPRRSATIPRRRRAAAGKPDRPPRHGRPHGVERAGSVLDPGAGVDRETARPLLPLLRGSQGSYIRLAYADRLEGPWRTHEPGSLQLADSHFLTEPAPVPAGSGGDGKTGASAAPATGYAAARSRAFRARSRARRCRTSRRPTRTCGTTVARSSSTTTASTASGRSTRGSRPRPTASDSGPPRAARLVLLPRLRARRRLVRHRDAGHPLSLARWPVGVRAGADSLPAHHAPLRGAAARRYPVSVLDARR